MKKRKTIARRCVTGAGVFAISVLTVSCMQSVVVPVNVGSGFTVPNFNGALPGDPIPADFEALPISVCDPLPGRDAIQAMVQGGLGGLLGSLIHVESVDFLDATVTAGTGDFHSFTRFGVAWQPAQGQAAVDLGSVASATGLTSPVVIVPPETVDYLALADLQAQGLPDDCPTIQATIEGRVPNVIPTWDIQVRIRVNGRIGF